MSIEKRAVSDCIDIYEDMKEDDVKDICIFVGRAWASGQALVENKGTLEIPIWEVVSEQFASIDVGTWFTFADIDADNDLDLFCDSRNGKVFYYQNNQPPQSTSSAGNFFSFIFQTTEIEQYTEQISRQFRSQSRQSTKQTRLYCTQRNV